MTWELARFLLMMCGAICVIAVVAVIAEACLVWLFWTVSKWWDRKR